MNHAGNCHVEPISRQPEPEELEDLTDTMLLISGMGCPSCAMRVQNALVAERGVIDAQVDHVSGRALVRHNHAMVHPRDLIALVHSASNRSGHRYAAALP